MLGKENKFCERLIDFMFGSKDFVKGLILVIQFFFKFNYYKLSNFTNAKASILSKSPILRFNCLRFMN